MRESIDGLSTYMVGLGAAFYGSVLAHSPDFMSLGGMVLLAARLYVDGTRVIREFRRGRNGE